MESKGGLFRGSVDDIAFPFVSTLNGATGFNGGCLFFFASSSRKQGDSPKCSMTWYSKLWICMAICQHLQRGAKWFLKGVNSPSLRALGFNAKLKRYIPVFGWWFHVFFTTTYGDDPIWLITRFLKWWNLSLLSRCDASQRVVSGNGRVGGFWRWLSPRWLEVFFSKYKNVQ